MANDLVYQQSLVCYFALPYHVIGGGVCPGTTFFYLITCKTKATVGGPPVFTGVYEPLARVTLYLADENGLGSCFGAP